MQTLLLLAALALGQQPVESPAQRAIAAAETRLAAEPQNPNVWNDLALAHARRARETADPAHYERAAEAVARSLELAPGDFTAKKLDCWILLGRHEFQAALEQARALNRAYPDDVLVYGFVVDACVELGLYEEAEKACQWMLDLRPGNVPGMTRAAYLRELFGDVDGAIELMTAAYHAIRASETEDRAWTLTQIGHLMRSRGELELARETLQGALELFPDYHYALAELGRVETERGELARALELYQRRHAVAPHPENLFDVGKALVRADRAEEAAAAFAEFETAARAEMENADNANRELVEYYTDARWQAVRAAGGAAEALAIAEREAARRGDLHTRATQARALLANGRASEARAVLAAALAVGVRDAELFALAGRIELALGDASAARERYAAALSLHPRSLAAAEARSALSAAGPAGNP
jgi:tetratricopeptide (TPR) repeat protein